MDCKDRGGRGDGDLRYTLNKEAASDVLSLLMQSGFSGRAEIGLIGADDLTLKVSADGSIWKTALSTDKTSAQVQAPYGIRGLIIPEAAQVVAAISTEPKRNRTFLIDDLVRGLVAAGVWAKLGALYVLAAADSQAALLNWINPSGTAATAVNSPTFAVNRGYTGDGAAAYINSNMTLSAVPNYALNSACMFAWSLTDLNENKAIVAGSANNLSLITPRSGGNFRTHANSSFDDVAVADSLGLFTWSRGSSTGYDRYKNATSVGAATQTSTAIDSGTLVALRSFSTYTTRQLAVFGVGGFLSSSEVAALYNALYAYLHDTTVGAV